MTSKTWLIYGANGYTGELIAREAARRGLKPILAGRNRAAIEALSVELGLESRIFGLDDPKVIAAGLNDCAVVLHCAGPFSRTAKPMIEACLLTHTHYLDITGEIAVFEMAATFDAVAKLASIMLLPGVGFDVVPTDCLAAHLKAQLPTATHLALAFRGLGRTSRGTTLTGLEGMSTGGMIRRDGKLMPVPAAWKTRRIDFGNGRGPTARSLCHGAMSPPRITAPAFPTSKCTLPSSRNRSSAQTQPLPQMADQLCARAKVICSTDQSHAARPDARTARAQYQLMCGAKCAMTADVSSLPASQRPTDIP